MNNPNTETIKIGLVTVLYHSDRLLNDFFSSIALQDHKNHVLYLIDNSPSQLTRELVKQLGTLYSLHSVKHIECSSNNGVAHANNKGIELALTDGCAYIVLLNNDICFNDSKLFSSLLLIAETNRLPIIAPKIYYYGTNKLWYAGGEIRPWQGGAKHLHDREEDTGQANQSRFTGYAPTTFMLIKAVVFKTITKLDERFFIYVEDLDFVYRAVKARYKVWYEAGFHLQHKVSSTTGGILSDAGFYYNTRNRVYFARKSFSPFTATVGILYVFISLFYHALKQNRKAAVKSFLKGFLNGLKMPVNN